MNQNPLEDKVVFLKNNLIKHLNFDDVLNSAERIKDYIIKTPTIFNEQINEIFANEIYFKLENLQQTGSFKARGVFNTILSYKEKNGEFPKKIVAVSSGNHAQAVAFACKQFGIKALIYMAKGVSSLKLQTTISYGAEVIVTETRIEANHGAAKKAEEGYFLIHPNDNDDVILGQATSCLETLNEIKNITFVSAACGGGGLVSGCFLAAKGFENVKVLGCEPLNGNDAAISLKTGEIFNFPDSPNTIADGARSLSISARTFRYLKQIEGMMEVTEDDIIYWSQWLTHILKLVVEPTAALAFAGLVNYLRKNPQIKNQKLLVILSGGNISSESYQKIYRNDFLHIRPK